MGEKKDLFFKRIEKDRELIEKALFDHIGGSLNENSDKPGFMKKYRDAFSEYSEGGKRIRAFMVLLGYNMCGRETDDDIVRASLSYELFQSGVLIHDDIIDDSDLRRNRPAMHVRLGGGSSGISKAICVGDYGIISAADAVLLTKFDDDRKVKAIQSLNETFKLTIAGEIKDIELSEEENCSMEDILTMYELKTSRYTFIGPIQLGMILGGADEELLNGAGEFGRLTGIAFQIKDDILGIYGDTKNTGKSNVSDIEEGKKTVLTAFFTDRASDEMKAEFDGLYGRGFCDEGMAARVRELFDECGAHAYAEGLLQDYSKRASGVIENLPVAKDHKDILFGLIEYLNERVS